VPFTPAQRALHPPPLPVRWVRPACTSGGTFPFGKAGVAHHVYQSHADDLYIPMTILAIAVLAIPPLLMLVAGAVAIHRIDIACRAVVAPTTEPVPSVSREIPRVSPGIGKPPVRSDSQWPGWDLNPGPTDYESAALTN
jgi:hypothetical protein